MVPLASSRASSSARTPLAVNHQGLFVATTISFNLATGQVAERRRRGDRERDDARDRHAGHHPRQLPGHGARSSSSRSTAAPDLWRRCSAVYIVLGILYESYIHPLTILSTLPSAGVGALLALLICRHRVQHHRPDRRDAADRHRQEERHHDDRLRARRRAPARRLGRTRRSTRPACCASGRS